MRLFLLMAGAATLAIGAPALAQGKGNGHDGGHGGGPAKAEKAGKPAKADRGPDKVRGLEKHAEARPEKAMRANPDKHPDKISRPDWNDRNDRQIARGDRYADTPQSLYRYSDGYVYEVDPTTQLVRTVIELIA